MVYFSNSKLLMLFLSVLFLNGCGSSSILNEYEEILECHLSAEQLIFSEFIENDGVIRNIDKYISEQSYASELTDNEKYQLDNKSREIHDKFNDPGMDGLKGSLFYPIKVYNSNTCLKMHKKNKIDIGSMDFEFKVLYYAAYLFV